MIATVDLEKMFHRSKSRIKNLGEVFTPKSYAEDMLDLLAENKKGIWSNEEIAFFEPCAGHGNIVIAIYKRRLDGIYKKMLSRGTNEEAAYCAVANALNTLWAIDIDQRNVENCRSRVLSTTLEFLKSKLNITSDKRLFAKRKDFFAHLLSAIKWHIDINESLSALSDAKSAVSKASHTKSGSKWFAQNGHHQIDFDSTWANFYEECEINNTVPIEYERSSRFVECVIVGKLKGFDDYEFAKMVINENRPLSASDTVESVSAGA